jgi:hypothetical protein
MQIVTLYRSNRGQPGDLWLAAFGKHGVDVPYTGAG